MVGSHPYSASPKKLGCGVSPGPLGVRGHVTLGLVLPLLWGGTGRGWVKTLPGLGPETRCP